MKKYIYILVLILSLGLIFAGCSNQNNPISEDNSSNSAYLTGTVKVPTGTPTESTTFLNFIKSKAFALENENTLPNATLTIKNYNTGKLITTVETDKNGEFTITSLPDGADILIIATKDINGHTVRVSTVIPDVDESLDDTVINTVTSFFS